MPLELQKPVRVLAFTGSRTISSRRFRVEQYVSPLAGQAIYIDEDIATFGSWPPKSVALRPAWMVATLCDRLLPVVRSRAYDITLLQRELVSSLYTLERFTGRPRLLDVDDAVWLNSRRAARSFAELSKSCDGVICGNEFLSDAVGEWNRNRIILPTAVDTDRFVPSAPNVAQRPIVGWSGLEAGARFLVRIEPALKTLLAKRPDVILRIVSDARPPFQGIAPDSYEFIRWSPQNEVSSMQEMTVGLMPIDDTPFARGKCSYKMLLYMSCGVPVVVSPVGMNIEVLAKGGVGLSPNSQGEWVDSLLWILDNPAKASEMGRSGRRVVLEHYCLSVLARRLGEFIREQSGA